MLRTACVHSISSPYSIRAACCGVARIAPRYLSTTTAPPNNLTNRAAEATAISPHRKKDDSFLTKPGPTSTVPTKKPKPHQGDWVLFHPVYTPDELKAIEVLHRDAKTISDRLAFRFVKIARGCFDLVSGYVHKELPPNASMSIEELRKGKYILTDKQWLARVLFLESIAGVPGMVAATVRHLVSLRLMKRDNGWIHTCLEEAENERMHLMTFMSLRKPSIFFRGMILGAQGVFYNLFFLTYLFNPNACHRFVGYLEEEAVITYTKVIHDMEAGLIPEWNNAPAPPIAIDYWRLKKDATLLDVMYAVRADETTHRFVNHSFANLNNTTDVSPFCLREPDMFMKGKNIDFNRSESEAWVKESHTLREELDAQKSKTTTTTTTTA